MREDRKCSSVKLESRFDLILLRAENEASQTRASPGGGTGGTFPPPETRKICKG